ncbi:NAD(P)-dependent alcohol dehydrogenase [Aurantivibrio infirmus]
MRAVIYEKYGSPNVLELKEVAKPAPKPNEVLIKVHSVSINDWDWGLLHGKPFINRMSYGLSKPKKQILGSDVAGAVEQIGSSVTKFKVGDEVFGDLSTTWGGFAEYVCATEQVLSLKPTTMSFEQAAAIPQAGLLALQGLYDEGRISSGQDVLINGGGGGAGTFAIQIAKSEGALVTAVDHTKKLEAMKALGADHVIDYTTEDFTKNKKQFDLIYDVKTNRSIYDIAQSLKPGGTYVTVGGNTKPLLQALLIGKWIKISQGKNIRILFLKTNKGLDEMVRLFDSGNAKPVIDKIYSLNETPEAMRRFGESSQCGKIVIKVE